MIGARLPVSHRYGPVEGGHEPEPGFEVWTSLVSLIGSTFAPIEGSVVAGFFRPQDGYTTLLVIDASELIWSQLAKTWWIVREQAHVRGVRSVPVSDLHYWLRQQADCLDDDGELDQERVMTWVRENAETVLAWIEQQSVPEKIAFIDTLSATQN